MSEEQVAKLLKSLKWTIKLIQLLVLQLIAVIATIVARVT
jgi:hypothetical protein